MSLLYIHWATEDCLISLYSKLVNKTKRISFERYIPNAGTSTFSHGNLNHRASSGWIFAWYLCSNNERRLMQNILVFVDAEKHAIISTSKRMIEFLKRRRIYIFLHELISWFYRWNSLMFVSVFFPSKKVC